MNFLKQTIQNLKKSYSNPVVLIVLAILIVLLIIMIASYQPDKPISYLTTPHNGDCYSQGIFFLNDTHIFESCGMYNLSYVHVLSYEESDSGITITQQYRSVMPFERGVFLEGATLFKGFIYMLTWRENIVYKLDP